MMADSQELTVSYKLFICTRRGGGNKKNTLPNIKSITSVRLTVSALRLLIANQHSPKSSRRLMRFDLWRRPARWWWTTFSQWPACITAGWFAYTLHRFTSFDIGWSVCTKSFRRKSHYNAGGRAKINDVPIGVFVFSCYTYVHVHVCSSLYFIFIVLSRYQSSFNQHL